MTNIDLEGLAGSCLELCLRKKWSRHWESIGCHLHLESSEYVEALRGKTGDPVEEAGDILFVLLSSLRFNEIEVSRVFESLERKIQIYDKSPPSQRPLNEVGGISDSVWIAVGEGGHVVGWNESLEQLKETTPLPIKGVY